MRRLILAATVAVLLFLSASSATAEEWKKSFNTSGKASLRVETNDAEIRVAAWDQTTVEAHVFAEGYSIGGSGVRVNDRQNGDQVELEVHRPSGVHLNIGRVRSVRIEISVPRQSDLDLHTSDGNIRIDGVHGVLRLDSGDGELEARSTDGRLTADSRDGNVRAEGRFDSLDLHTSDGNIEASVDGGSKVTSTWMLRTGDGSVTLRVPENLNADLDAHTGDGRVHSDLPLTIVGAIKEDAVRGKLNGGGQTIELRTGDGNIDLESNLSARPAAK